MTEWFQTKTEADTSTPILLLRYLKLTWSDSRTYYSVRLHLLAFLCIGGKVFVLLVGLRSDLVIWVLRVVIGQCNNDLSISCLRLDDIFRGDRSSSSDCTLSQLRLFTLEQHVVFSCSRLSESVVNSHILCDCLSFAGTLRSSDLSYIYFIRWQ